MLLDAHTHAFADKIADKAVNRLIDYYRIKTTHGGRLANLLRTAVESKLDALVMLVAATKPEQVRPANDWVLDVVRTPPDELCARFGLAYLPCVVPFGAFHIDAPDWLNEVRRLRAAGIKGIKLHPEFQGIDLADPRLKDFFAEIEADFILITHVGDELKDGANLSTPRKVAAILDDFPRLRLIAAHLGGYCFWEESFEFLAGRDVYFDTSSSLPYIDQGLRRRLFAKHGTERILFGSDFPLRQPLEEMRQLEQLEWLDDTDKERILGGNCMRLLREFLPQDQLRGHKTPTRIPRVPEVVKHGGD